jgi:DNA-binding NtrC family response regulator
VLSVDVRVVSATNKNLREEVKAGKFREDLLYRLDVVTLHVPPLKERRDDIPILADYFLARKAKSKNPKKLTGEALNCLMTYDWPGNVRELEHVIEGAILLSSGEYIEESDLSMHFHRTDRTPSGMKPDIAAAPGQPLSLEELEKLYIERILKENKYSRTKTASVLGISKKTLYLKIKRYGMKSAD